jgi:predicted RecB family nuclease
MLTSFSIEDRTHLLAVKGVGPTVIRRLEEMGFRTLPQLAAANMQTIVEMGASMTGSSCWKNNPQARAAIQGAIAAANGAANKA